MRSVTRASTTTTSDAASRTGTAPSARPAANAPAAIAAYTPCSSQVYPRPISLLRTVNQQNSRPPLAHCRRTVAASRRITPCKLGDGYAARPVKEATATPFAQHARGIPHYGTTVKFPVWTKSAVVALVLVT